MRRWIILSLAAMVLIGATVLTQNGSDEKAIREVTQRYADSFNKRDVKALKQLWADDGVYTNPRTGVVAEGPDGIEEQYNLLFQAGGDAKLTADIQSIDVKNGTGAIETGVVTVTRPNQPEIKKNYRVYLQKVGNEWKLSRFTEVEEEEATSNYDHLKALDWLVGNWIDQDEDTKIETRTAWDKSKNFLAQNFTISVLDKQQLEGLQLIGWDPINEQIRSWVFDSDGGFGEGKWTHQGDKWIVTSTYTLSNGDTASATYMYSDITLDSHTWQATNREVGGELLPNIEPVTVTRQHPEGS